MNSRRGFDRERGIIAFQEPRPILSASTARILELRRRLEESEARFSMRDKEDHVVQVSPEDPPVQEETHNPLQKQLVETSLKLIEIARENLETAGGCAEVVNLLSNAIDSLSFCKR